MITVYVPNEISFETCLARIAYKIFVQDAQARMMMLCSNEEQMALYDRAFWTFNPEAFLPHGLDHEPYSENQPVLITSNIKENRNSSTFLLFSNIEGVTTWEMFEHYIWVTSLKPEEIKEQIPSNKSYRVFTENKKKWSEVFL